MDVKEILKKFDLSQQELADFTGIQRSTIGKWVSENKQPPKVGDQAKLLMAVKFFTGKTPEQIKTCLRDFTIVLNNIVSKKELAGLVNEGVEPYGNQYNIKEKSKKQNNPETPENQTTGIEFGTTNSYTNNGKTMDRLLNIWEESNSNVAILARALDKFADSHKSLSLTLERLVPAAVEPEVKRRRVG